MSFTERLMALVKGTNNEQVQVVSTKQGDLYVVKRIPDFADLVLQKEVWKAQDLTTTAVLNNVLPTTVGGLTVQNPTSDLYYVVFAITAIIDVSPASLGSVGFSHVSHKQKVTTLFTRDVTNIGPYLPGQGSYNGEIILDRGATVTDDGWTPIGDSASNVVNSQDWMNRYIPLHIPVVIPPGYHYSIGVTGNDATFEAGLGLVWAELTAEELK